jgi:hypothetical protein
VIHNAKVNSITIDKQHEIDLKIYALTFKIRNITITFLKTFLCVEIQFDYKFIMPKLFMANVFLFPCKRSSQK